MTAKMGVLNCANSTFHGDKSKLNLGLAQSTMLPEVAVKRFQTATGIEHSFNNNETLEEMKERLKSGLHNPPLKSVICVANALANKSPLINDLSQSLPNLVASDPDFMQRIQLERQVRNSCSDIYEREHLVIMDEKGEASCGEIPCLTKPRTKNSVMVTLSPDDNGLSAVLQNIPLVYIPGTKQLGLVTSPSIGACKECASSKEKSDEISSLKELSLANQDIKHSTMQEDIIDIVRERHCSKTESEISNGNHSIASSQFMSDASTSSDKTVVETSKGDKSFDGSFSSSAALVNCDDLDQVSLSDEHNTTGDSRTEVPLIQRTDTSGSFGTADAVSFSSIGSVSTGTEFSLSAASFSDDISDLRPIADTDDSGFTEVNLQSGNTFERSRNSSQDSGFEEKQQALGAKPKRRGLTSFLSRSIFSKKPKDAGSSSAASALGWKLFGRVPPKESPIKDDLKEECSTVAEQEVYRAKDIEVSSTTALILQTRPQGLPSKTPEEERKHRMEYDAMVEAAKKREIKEAKMKKKQMQRQIKHEENLKASLQVWTKEILPNWEAMHPSKRARDLWWLGLPPSIRGRIWKLAIGNDLNLTNELYEICGNRAKDRLKMISEDSDTDSLNEPASCKESSVELIKLDISRTFPQLCIFQKGGPYYDILHSLLGAYVCYRPDVGYVQGMSFIAAVLLLNMDASDAFTCFSNLLNQPCQIAFFRLDEILMKSYFATYEEFLEENIPKLYHHFRKQNLTPDLYLIDWMFTLYSKSLPLDVASRVWDVFCRDGEEFLFRTALGVLKLYEEVLMNLDFIHLAQFLTRLPESLSGDRLFRCIERVRMTTDNKTFGQALASHKDSTNREAS